MNAYRKVEHKLIKQYIRFGNKVNGTETNYKDARKQVRKGINEFYKESELSMYDFVYGEKENFRLESIVYNK